MILSSIGLYPNRHAFAFVPKSISTPCLCVFSSPDQMNSPLDVSACPVQCTSDIPTTVYSYLFISFLSNYSLPADQSVRKFHVPTVNMCLATFICSFRRLVSVRCCCCSSSQLFDSVLIPPQRTQTLFTQVTSDPVSAYKLIFHSWFLSSFLFFVQTAVSVPLPSNASPFAGLATGMKNATAMFMVEFS